MRVAVAAGLHDAGEDIAPGSGFVSVFYTLSLASPTCNDDSVLHSPFINWCLRHAHNALAFHVVIRYQLALIPGAQVHTIGKLCHVLCPGDALLA